MANYLVTLGWGPPDGVEIRPMSEVVDLFRLEDVTKSSAAFDVKKLDHFNGEYVRALPTATFVRQSLPWLETDAPWPPERFDIAKFETLAPLVQERVTVLSEVPAMVDFVFLESPAFDDAAWDKVMVRGVDLARPMLTGCVEAFAALEHWTSSALHDATLAVGESLDAKLGKAQAPVRVAVTGRTVGPPLFESLEVLGRDVTLERLTAALARLP
jgi:glutamyl-tRNA synthetase